jgi:excisionase family DNA binding protein
MRSSGPGVTDRAVSRLEPLAVSPHQACLLLGVGNTRLYELIGNGELQSYLDGRARRITMDSIHRRVARLLAATATTVTDVREQSSNFRGRPRKPKESAHHER